MIFTEKKITINNNQCKIDSPVVLYRGDYNVEVRFTIVSSPYKYSNKQETNVIESTEASFGQLVIETPNTTPTPPVSTPSRMPTPAKPRNRKPATALNLPPSGPMRATRSSRI